MNKSELVAQVAERAGVSRKDAEKTLHAMTEVIMETLTAGEKVQLVGFGTFEVRDRAERKGHNPKTKEEIFIPASRAPVFKPGKLLKDTVGK